MWSGEPYVRHDVARLGQFDGTWKDDVPHRHKKPAYGFQVIFGLDSPAVHLCDSIATAQ